MAPEGSQYWKCRQYVHEHPVSRRWQNLRITQCRCATQLRRTLRGTRRCRKCRQAYRRDKQWARIFQFLAHVVRDDGPPHSHCSEVLLSGLLRKFCRYAKLVIEDFVFVCDCPPLHPLPLQSLLSASAGCLLRSLGNSCVEVEEHSTTMYRRE